MKVPLLDLQPQYAPLRDEIRAAIDEVCDTQSLILGPAVERFETHLAAYCHTPHALGVSSGTDALLIALMALGIGPGDEVIVPAFTFFATAGCVSRLGATPVFADIEYASFNLDPQSFAQKITPKTKAVIPVHLFGQCARMDAINAVASAHNIAVIEDAAQAIGATRHGQPACTMSRIGCLSFYPTKNLGAFGDAGAVCTADDQLHETMRKLRIHGSGHTYYHEMVGGMFRMAAIQGAVLDVKLKYLDGWHAARRRNAATYDTLLKGSNVVTPAIDAGNQSIYNQYVVRVPQRDQVQRELASAGVQSAVYYPLPLHLQPCFAPLGGREGDHPVSEQAAKQVLALPIHPELTDREIHYVAAQLRTATTNKDEG
jgi:dTDP-4-amino-4,6-dideoxygalactose transaminase